MAGCAGGSDERHALLAARGEQRAEAGPGDQLLRRRYNGGGVAGGKAAGLLQLTPVRRHPGSAPVTGNVAAPGRSDENTSELQSLKRDTHAVLCLKTDQHTTA